VLSALFFLLCNTPVYGRFVLPIVTRLQGVAQVSPTTGGIVYTFDDVVVTAASAAEEVSGRSQKEKEAKESYKDVFSSSLLAIEMLRSSLLLYLLFLLFIVVALYLVLVQKRIVCLSIATHCTQCCLLFIPNT